MKDFLNKRGGLSYPRFTLSFLGAGVLLIAAFFSLRTAWGMYEKLLAATDQKQAAQVELANLQVQQERVQTATQELASERGVEMQVRQRYGVAKPGEGEIRIVSSGSSTTPSVSAPTGFFSHLWHALFVW